MLTTLSVIELSTRIRAGEISAVDITLAYINRIEKFNPQINALVQFNPERALAQAKKLDQLQAQGKLQGLLHGVPFTLKDVYNTQGDRVTAGCLGLKDNIATEDGEIVKRLYRAGGILLGKTNTPELECALETDNLIYGKTVNPYHFQHSAGGSSGGSAAAVAAGFSAFDIGADQGGSLRVPAHYNGVATIRATPGRIPTTGLAYGQRFGFGALFTTEGPIARSASDLSLLLNILNGQDGIDPKVVHVPLLEIAEFPEKKLKVAFLTDDGNSQVSPEIKQAVEKAANALSQLGAQIEETKPLALANGYHIFLDMLGANSVNNLKTTLRQLNFTEISPLILKLIERMQPYICDLPTFMQRWLRWDQYRSDMLQFMQQYDLLILPVTGQPALPLSKSMWDAEMMPSMSYCWAIGAALLPSAVVRTGTSKQGLPIGVQLVAKPWREDIALNCAVLVEQQLGGWQAPAIASPESKN